jgi:hypothetical protein
VDDVEVVRGAFLSILSASPDPRFINRHEDGPEGLERQGKPVKTLWYKTSSYRARTGPGITEPMGVPPARDASTGRSTL